MCVCVCFHSTSSKKKKSLTISAPIPCNTAFPPDHPALSKLSVPDALAHRDTDTPSGNTQTENSDSDDSGSAESIPSTPSRQSVCSESESAKHHASNGNTTERPGGEDADEEDVSEEVHVSETPAKEEEDEAESVNTTECKEEEEETGQGEEEVGGETKQSEEMEKGREPEVTSSQPDSSKPPGFLYKVGRCSRKTINLPDQSTMTP